MNGPGYPRPGEEVPTPEGHQDSPPRGQQRAPHRGGHHPDSRPPEASHSKGKN